MLRAAVSLPGPGLPEWPGPGSSLAGWQSWLSAVWADVAFRRAVAGASTDLARQVQAVVDGESVSSRRARRAALAIARYAIRYAHRSTPFGLFAGVSLAEFGGTSFARIGDGNEVISRPDPVQLRSAISNLQADPVLMAGVRVCVNNLARIRDGRVQVPSEGSAQFSLAQTPAVTVVLDAAKTPLCYSDLVAKLAAKFPESGKARCALLVSELVRTCVLVTSLRPAATVADPAGTLPSGLLEISEEMQAASDVRLDAEVRLSGAVSVEIETAASVLARLTPCPAGTAAWHRYAERFADRFGEDTEVRLERLVDPDHGLGLPDGFASVSEPPRPMTRRDRLLLELAGNAALQNCPTVILTEPMIEDLEASAGGPPKILAPHLEVCAQVQAHSLLALDAGNFRVRIQAVSRAAGSMTGRFWHLLPDAAAEIPCLPTVDIGAELAQLSFHPSRAEADLLTRAPQVLPRLVSVGEFRDGDDGILVPADLVVGMQDRRLYLAAAATGTRVELLAPTAINFLWNSYTPPLVRFLAEISRAFTSQVAAFDWGTAWTLPFTPALHYRRSILIPARWRLRAEWLPGRTASIGQWTTQLQTWRDRAGVPDRVLLVMDDQHLLLDLTREMDLDILRARLGGTPAVILHDAPPPDADGWIGGRAHSIVVAMRACS